MKVSNVKIYGLNESIVASGYPMRTIVSNDISNPTEKDMKRAERLGNVPRGSGHDNFLKGIIVQFDLECTIKVWAQLQRYHWIDFVSSCSTIHMLKKMDLEQSYCEFVDARIKEIMKELQRIYNENPTKENFLKLIYNNPVGMNLAARITTNYLQLKTFYAQRYNHPLPEQVNLCKWVYSLPKVIDLGVCPKRFVM